MLYDALFHFLDSIPTITFLVWFLVVYLLFHPVLYNILLRSPKYVSISYEKQSYILCNIMEVLVLVIITYIAFVAIWRKDISFLDTANHRQNPQVMINIATMYTMKDVVEMFVNKKIAKSTIVHHICVIMAYFYVLRVLTTDYNVEGIFKCFIAYAAFTTLDFPYEIYLALRFFIDKNGRFNNICKKYAFFHNFCCVLMNFSWQTFYFIRLIASFYQVGSSVLTLAVSGLVYLVLMAGWAQEEYVVMDHLWKL